MTAKTRQQAAEILTDAVTSMRASDSAGNWLSGYSLAEALDERIRRIGQRDGPRILAGDYTKIGKLEHMRDTVSALVTSSEFAEYLKE